MKKGTPARSPLTPEPGQGDLFGMSASLPVGGDARATSTPQPAAPVAPPVAAPSPKPQRTVLTVGELTRQIKGTLESGFPRVTVRGEVSGFRGANARGHLYFSLKDPTACVDTKVWASLASRMKFRLRDGLEVIVEGSIDLYEPQGRYSLIVQRIEPAGEGALALAFQQLKERLMAEGLFGDKRVRPQRPIPFLPRRIGVVTSLTGAALRDFLRVLHQRHPRIPVLICDARVQGEGSAAEVVRGIKRLSRTDVDVIVVTRGGGSIEDLWTFNEESVARAIFDCPVPVVSAIGHEVDHTIADFVADYRAPTPSAAAEKLSPVLQDLELHLATTRRRLHKAIERQVLADRQRIERLRSRMSDPRRVLGQKRLHLGAQADRLDRSARQAVRKRREALKALAERLSRQRPQARLRQNRQELQKLSERLRAAIRETLRRNAQPLQRARSVLQRQSPQAKIRDAHRKLSMQQGRLVELQRARLFDARRRLFGDAAKLEAMSPLKVMARGYSVTFRADGRVVRRAADVAAGDSITVRLAGAACESLESCDRIEATVVSAVGTKPDLA